MRSFLGGISKYLVNWHYYPKNFEILQNKNDFMINSMIKSIGAPSLIKNNNYIQLEEIYINSLDNYKLVLEVLDGKATKNMDDVQRIRENYPEYFFIEKSLGTIAHSNEYNLYVEEYLRHIKKVKTNTMNIQSIEIDKDCIGLYVQINR